MGRWLTRALAALLLVLIASAVPAQELRRGSTFDTLTVPTSIAVGGSGTVITQIRVYSQALTPAATTAAIQTAEQTFTVTGLATTDKVIVNGPAPTSLCPPTTARVSGTNTLAIGFTVLTAAICTPAAGTYLVVAIRS